MVEETGEPGEKLFHMDGSSFNNFFTYLKLDLSPDRSAVMIHSEQMIIYALDLQSMETYIILSEKIEKDAEKVGSEA